MVSEDKIMKPLCYLQCTLKLEKNQFTEIQLAQGHLVLLQLPCQQQTYARRLISWYQYGFHSCKTGPYVYQISRQFTLRYSGITCVAGPYLTSSTCHGNLFICLFTYYVSLSPMLEEGKRHFLLNWLSGLKFPRLICRS